jgi:hypothetical protein
MRRAPVIWTAILVGAACLTGPASRPAAGDDSPPEGALLAAGARPSGGAPAARAATPSARPAEPPPAGATLAAQQRLAERLNALKGPSLAAALDHNRAEWTSLSPDQRDRFRQEALAFLDQSPEQQDRLLRQYQRLIALSAERQENYRRIAQWVRVVVDSMTAEERKALLEMPPQQRAKALLERKRELIEQGKLSPDAASAASPSVPPATPRAE